MTRLKHISFSLLAFFIIVSISYVAENDAFAQNPQLSNSASSNFNSNPNIENLLKIFESPQSLLKQLSIDFGRDVSAIDLLSFSFGMVAYGVLYGIFIGLLQKERSFLLLFKNITPVVKN